MKNGNESLGGKVQQPPPSLETTFLDRGVHVHAAVYRAQSCRKHMQSYRIVILPPFSKILSLASLNKLDGDNIFETAYLATGFL
jgi:hypothetical protein